MQGAKVVCVPKELNFWGIIKNTFSCRRSWQIAILLILVGLSLMAKYFSYYVPSLGINISAVTIPVMLVGIYLGPIVGAVNGILVDIISNFSFGTSGNFHLLYTLQLALYGFIPGVILMFIKIKKYTNNKQKWALANEIVIATTLINSLILGTIFVAAVRQDSWNFSFFNILLLVGSRIIKEIIKAPITIVIVYLFIWSNRSLFKAPQPVSNETQECHIVLPKEQDAPTPEYPNNEEQT